LQSTVLQSTYPLFWRLCSIDPVGKWPLRCPLAWSQTPRPLFSVRQSVVASTHLSREDWWGGRGGRARGVAGTSSVAQDPRSIHSCWFVLCGGTCAPRAVCCQYRQLATLLVEPLHSPWL
jgi:hypothetical protein